MMKCAACGGTALVEGTLMDANSTNDISFKAGETSFIKRILASGIGASSVRTGAFIVSTCSSPLSSARAI